VGVLDANLSRAVDLVPGDVEGTEGVAAADLGWWGAEPYAGRWDVFSAALGQELAGGGCCVIVSRQEGGCRS